VLGRSLATDAPAADDISELVQGPNGFDLVSADGRVVVDAALLADGRGYLDASRLPRLSRSRTYQLWAVMDDATISLGLLGPTPEVSAFTLAGRPTALAITEEAAGGVVTSRNTPVVAGTLT
jgi:anti-sigma-K factor RskA